MTDTNKRNSLKTLTISAAALVAGPAWSMMATAKPRQTLSINVESNPDAMHDTITFTNPTADNVELTFARDSMLAVPGGQLDINPLVNNGAIRVEAGGQFQTRLPRAEYSGPFALDQHSAMRFPVANNIIIGSIDVRSSNAALSGVTPVILSRSTV